MLFGTWSQAHAYDPSDYMETKLKVVVCAEILTRDFLQTLGHYYTCHLP